ncbi:MAG: hypothetical protein R3E32_08995 [Chitinophagales bacterium]
MFRFLFITLSAIICSFIVCKSFDSAFDFAILQPQPNSKQSE